MGVFPLGAGYENGSDIAFRREIFLEPVNVGFLPREGNAGAGINAELDHLISVVNQKVAETSRLPALLLGSHWKIECDNQPAHFEFFGVHGL